MGGLVYTNNFPSAGGNNGTFVQAQHWSFFIGANSFCGKICDQTGSNPQGLCQNIYDRLGCQYNAPNNAQAGVFESCDGDDMTPVGTYVVNGVTSVYHQPPSETIPINDGDVPYTPAPAPTSNCVPFQSAAIFTDGVSVTPASGGSASSTPTGSGSSTGSSTGSSGSKPTSSTGSSKPTGSSPSQSGVRLRLRFFFGLA
ncbi:hypothetical protein B0H19DRAFT_1122813 [Mycena capillaripes]|nr:hypothetical protein B0H19DRAFT_1122813 [Mycena capillaripes]